MQLVQLHNTPVKISQIAFGCGGLSGMNSNAEALGLLEVAYGHGVTHFDVARSYGYGTSESILAPFLQGKRDKITVTSKYGVPVGSMPGGKSGFMKTVKRVVKSLPGIRTLARKSMRATAAPITFSVGEAEASLEMSLRELRTDYLDLFLLHEASVEDAGKAEMIGFFERQIAAGKIRAAGMGSDFAKFGGDAVKVPKPFEVLQFQSNLEHPNHLHLQNAAAKSIIAHGALRIVKPVMQHLAKEGKKRDQIMSFLAPNTSFFLPGILLKLSSISAPVQAVLFSTNHRAHLESNLSFVNNTAMSSEAGAQITAILSSAFQGASA